MFTIGHSTRELSEFLALLQAHAVTKLIDVRTVPRSAHNPQFGSDLLRRSLLRAGIGYEHVPALGGFRKPLEGSTNTGWRNKSFQGYADWMQSPDFDAALSRIVSESGTERQALMCAEAVPWRCHRSLIADALTVRGTRAEEIQSRTRSQVHALTPFARVKGTQITYPTEKKRASTTRTGSRPALGSKKRSRS